MMRTFGVRTQSGVALLAVAALAVSGPAGCASWSNTQKGAVIGAAGGAAAGAAIAKATGGKTAIGAIVGAAVGGTAGAMIGREMDRQAEQLAADIPNARVERVGEGILVTFDSGILFDFDSDRLRPAARENLTNLAASLQDYPRTNIMLVGHTDAVGTDWYNQGLSERRANAAASYLASQGINYSRVTSLGRGETEPIAENESDMGRQQNRRVEVAIYASEEYRREVLSRSSGR